MPRCRAAKRRSRGSSKAAAMPASSSSSGRHSPFGEGMLRGKIPRRALAEADRPLRRRRACHGSRGGPRRRPAHRLSAWACPRSRGVPARRSGRAAGAENPVMPRPCREATGFRPAGGRRRSGRGRRADDRRLGAADIGRQRAAGVELAAGWRVQRRGQVAVKPHALARALASRPRARPTSGSAYRDGAGATGSSSTGPISTISPRYITATRSQR